MLILVLNQIQSVTKLVEGNKLKQAEEEDRLEAAKAISTASN